MVVLADQYPNSPLFEVTWEIRFPVQLKILRILDKFQELVQDRYPVVNVINEEQFRLPQPGTPRFVGQFYEFRTESGDISIRIGSDRFALLNKKYTNFTELFEEIQGQVKNFQLFFDGAEKLPITRLGLRYVNLCKIPENNLQNYDNYFVTPLNTIFKGFSEINECSLKVQERYINNISLSTNYGIVETASRELSILMDFDAFRDNSSGDLTLSECLNLTSHLHSTIKEKFSSLIKESFVEEVMKGDR